MTQAQEQTHESVRKKRVLIVDDHPILRKGLSLLINQETDLMVGGEAEDARRAIEQIDALKPDLVIVDISCPASTASSCYGA